MAAFTDTVALVTGGTRGIGLATARAFLAAGARVHAVCPGRVATDMQEQYSGRRAGLAPERVAEAVLALAGPHPPIPPGRCYSL